jgi:uncharacterized protein (DUF983 family)
MNGCFSLVVYRGPKTRCPTCDRSNWWVRNVTAECAFCGLPLALQHALTGRTRQGAGFREFVGKTSG